MYAVFPHLRAIGKTTECAVYTKWYKQVMQPAFEKAYQNKHVRLDEVPPTYGMAIHVSTEPGSKSLAADLELGFVKIVVSGLCSFL